MEENEDTSIITLRVNSDQRESIIQFINFNEWELEEMICEENTTGNEDISADDFERTFCIPQSQNCDECEHCFCKPCITDGRNRQMWWPSEPALPDRRNTSFRKEKYKFFWTMLFHRGVFLDERYRERKLNVLQLDPRFTNVASHRRDILPECVVNLVRVWFPNPKNIPYMRHRWQLFFLN